MDIVGESAKDYFFFDKNGGLDLQLVVDNELKILSNLLPTHPIYFFFYQNVSILIRYNLKILVGYL